jgi:hypothetical protein
MIDRATGALQLSVTLFIAPNMPRTAFESAHGEAIAHVSRLGGDKVSYRLVPVRMAESLVNVTLEYGGEVLREATLMLADEDAGSWETWSLEAEMRRKAAHDALLQADLGAPPYNFAWGSVLSAYDSKAEFSFIVVRYREVK